MATDSGFLKSLYKEPLLHFLLISVLVFFLYDFNTSQHDNESADDIIVSEAELTKYMQYRKRAFSPETSQSGLAQLGTDELQDLIDNYVREQALYREAIALGLDQEDYIIKQRLVQKIEFLLKGFIEAELAITQDDVEKYYSSHPSKYTEPARVSFFHIYFNDHDRPQNETLERVTNVIGQLRNNQLAPAQLGGKGDRFIYFKHYVEKNRIFIAGHFGEAFSDQLFQLVDLNTWQGPLRSDHGEHIVWISNKHIDRIPPLEEVYGRVEDDIRTEKINATVEKKIQGIVQKYTVKQHYSDQKRQQDR